MDRMTLITTIHKLCFSQLVYFVLEKRANRRLYMSTGGFNLFDQHTVPLGSCKQAGQPGPMQVGLEGGALSPPTARACLKYFRG
jgi:hypothetical protein